MKIKKFAGGGVQFSPASVDYSAGVLSVLGQSQNTKSSSSSQLGALFNNDEKGSIGLLNKTMADALIKDTLPNEAQYIINSTDMFGQYIDPYDPSSATAAYTDILQKMQQAKYNKELYNDAMAKARERKSLRSPAVNSDGTVWVKTSEGLSKKPINEITYKDALLTVSELAQLRVYNPQFAFNPEMIDTIENSTSMYEIQGLINDIVTNIGSNEINITRYGTKGELSQLSQGLHDILNSATSAEGIYKGTIHTKTNSKAAYSLLTYIYTVLDPNQKAYLEVLANNSGVKFKAERGETVNPVFELIKLFIQGKIDTSETYSAEFDKEQTESLFGTSGGKKGSSSSDNLGDIKANPALLFYNELGQKEAYRMQYDGVTLTTIGTVGTLYDAQGHPQADWVTLSEVGHSMFAPTLDIAEAHFGGARITDRDRIQVDGSRIVNMYLPVDQKAKLHGETRPDFEMFKTATELQRKTANMTDINQINRLYQQAGLPKLIASITPEGRKVLTPEYGRFAVMEAFADKKVVPEKDNFGQDIAFDGTVQEVEDEALADTIVQRFKRAYSKDKSDKNDTFNESRKGFAFWSEPDLYQGLIFIPIKNNLANQYIEGATMNQMNKAEVASHMGEGYNSNTINVNY